MKKQFISAKVVATNVAFGPMSWSCAPNQSVATAARFCKSN